GRPAKIKWPNDILLGGKKVCGILIEQRASAGRLATIAGIGLNVSQTAEWFREAGLPDATSLACCTDAPLDWATVARELIQQLDEELDRLMEGDLATLEARWQWHLGLLGRTVTLELHGEPGRRGRLRDITFDGLVLEEAAGELLHLPPEKIKHAISVG